MGQTTSSIASKIAQPVSWMWGRKGETKRADIASYKGPSPFVLTRQSSMFFDEDGDLAHEFYEEVRIGKRFIMRRKRHNLIPQGEVELSHPRIHVDIPVVMCEALMTVR
ncbi:tumor suppressor candidate 2-like [Haliotis cracherodii]|uniref:tumor suppressor candidate 2-like n=1 Tax=Haliotis rufescens TaxID=6454 RepID=UPI001EB05A51|nr:tumor suppressor candidate 2-like [Haliotis rufescens]